MAPFRILLTPCPIIRPCTWSSSSVTSRTPPDPPACGGIGGVVFNRPMGLQPGERSVQGQRPGTGSAGNPHGLARCFPSGTPTGAFDPAAPLRAGPGKRLFQIPAEVGTRTHPQRPALDPSVLFHRLHAIRRSDARICQTSPASAGLRARSAGVAHRGACACGGTRPASAGLRALSAGVHVRADAAGWSSWGQNAARPMRRCGF